MIPILRCLFPTLGALACVCSLAAFVLADERQGEKQPPEPKPLMSKKGELILQDSFTGGKHAKDWFRITGKFEVVNDQLKCAEDPKDKHHSEFSTGATGPLKAERDK